MISFKNRFHGRNSIKPVYSKGKSARTNSLGLKYSFSPRRKEYRLAVVVSKKVHKSAVKRNRIRRRIYELARQNADELGNYDLVITAYSDILVDMPARELEEQVTKLLEQVR